MKISKRIQTSIFLGFTMITAIIFQIIPLKNIFIDGVFSWHIKQPIYLTGFHVLIFITAFLLYSVWYFNKNKTILFVMIAVSLSFLYYYNVLIPSALAILYFESIFSIGAILNKYFFTRDNHSKRALYVDFITGLLSWLVIALILSSLNIGSITNLKIMTLIIGVPALVLNINNLNCKHIYNNLLIFSKKELAFVSLILVIILMQFAKGNIGYDFDSLWYGLRPEQVLIPNNSFYENIGLLQLAHYYPKLVELFFIPLSFSNHYSFILAGNTVVLILLTVLTYRIFILLKVERILSLLFTLLIISIPTINNLASTAKTDIFTTFLLTLVIFQIISIFKNKEDLTSWVLLFITLLISLSAKYTSYLFLPALVLIVIILILIYKKDFVASIKRNENPKAWYLLIIAFIIFIGINLRTFLITGYPTYPLMYDFWNFIGFNGNFPFDHSIPFNNKVKNINNVAEKIIKGLWEYNFSPLKMIHLIVSWTGNLVLFLLIINIINSRNLIKKHLIPVDYFVIFGIIMIEYIVLRILFVSYLSRVYGQAGNYVMFPIIIISIFLLFFLSKISAFTNRKFIITICLIFFSFQSFYAYFSHWSWSCGIQKVKTSTSGCWADSEDFLMTNYYLPNKADNLVSYLRELPPNSKGILYYYDTRSESLENKPFPIIIETSYLTFTKGGYGISQLGSDIDLLKRYLKESKINYIIYKQGTTNLKSFNLLINEMNSNSEIGKTVIDDFTIYAINQEKLK